MAYQRHPVCDSAFCQECRTGEGELMDFEHDVEEILGRPITLEERKLVDAAFETEATPKEIARDIAANAAGLQYPGPPMVSQNQLRMIDAINRGENKYRVEVLGQKPLLPDPVWRNLDPDSDNFTP